MMTAIFYLSIVSYCWNALLYHILYTNSFESKLFDMTMKLSALLVLTVACFIFVIFDYFDSFIFYIHLLHVIYCFFLCFLVNTNSTDFYSRIYSVVMFYLNWHLNCSVYIYIPYCILPTFCHMICVSYLPLHSCQLKIHVESFLVTWWVCL